MENETEFEQVDINSFFATSNSEQSSLLQPKIEEKVECFTEHQRDLINLLMPEVMKRDHERAEIFLNRISDLEFIASSVARFPSLLEKHDIAGGIRTPTTLIDSLVKHQVDGDKTLQLPSKAILGKGLLVAKAHTLSSFSKYAKHMGPEFDKLYQAFDK